MIIDTHVHVWEIDPPRYPIGPTAPGWKSLPDEPGTADELLAEMDAPRRRLLCPGADQLVHLG